MPTDTMTDEHVVEILATKGMGWRVVTKHGTRYAYRKGEMPLVLGYLDCFLKNWNPIASLDDCREVEERLTEEQRFDYTTKLLGPGGPLNMGMMWAIRHASARTCAYALAEVLENK